METLWNLYEQRLNQLNSTFINLLSQFENNAILTTPQLHKYRIQYLGEIIEKTLSNDQQKLIKKLYKEIYELKNEKVSLLQQTNQLSKKLNDLSLQNSFKQKSLSSTKVSTNFKNRKNQNQTIDSILQNVLVKESKLKKTFDVKSQFQFDQNNFNYIVNSAQNILKSNLTIQESGKKCKGGALLGSSIKKQESSCKKQLKNIKDQQTITKYQTKIQQQTKIGICDNTCQDISLINKNFKYLKI